MPKGIAPWENAETAAWRLALVPTFVALEIQVYSVPDHHWD
jgi:hypothetical protein